MRYKNIAREQAEDEELERLEKEYIEKYSQPAEASEDDKPKTPEKLKEDESWEKRYKDLQSYAQRQVNTKNTEVQEKDRKIAELEAKLRETEKTELDHPETEEQAREWVNKYPDLARILKRLFKDEIKGVEVEVHAMRESLEKERHDIERQRAFAAVLKVHDDFNELIQNKDFQEWVDTQPEKRGSIGQSIYNALRNELNPQAAIEAVNIYKQDLKPKKTKRDEEIETIRQVRTSRSTPPSNDGKPVFLESQIEAMSLREYERFEDQIEEARREGRITYDISGALR